MGDRNQVYMLQDTVSVHRPGFYAHRFLDFCADRVFKKIPSREYCKSFAATYVYLRFYPFPLVSHEKIASSSSQHSGPKMQRPRVA